MPVVLKDCTEFWEAQQQNKKILGSLPYPNYTHTYRVAKKKKPKISTFFGFFF